MPISYLVAGPSTPRKTRLRDREDASSKWNAIENSIGYVVIADLCSGCAFVPIILQ